MTVGAWIRTAQSRLHLAGIESFVLEAQLLAAHVLLVDRPWLISHAKDEFPDLAAESLLQRRLAREPLAYILGKREFYGRIFAVRPGVLIPRHETEVLVEAGLAALRGRESELLTVLDLGTGSGCIAITLKAESPRVSIFASDISETALEIAEENARELNVDIQLVHSNGFCALSGTQFDLIVTNPPYIAYHEPLMSEVKDFEPASALYGGESGLEFYEMLAKEGKQHLNPSGQILMEVGYRQSEAVKAIFENNGWFHLDTAFDLSGVPRVVICSLELRIDDKKADADDT